VATLTTPLVEVMGEKTTKALAGLLKIERPTVGDLLRDYPRRLVERGELTDLGRLREGDDVTVMAEVQKCSSHSFGRRGKQGLDTRIEATVSDGRNTLMLTFFGRRNVWRTSELTPGTRALFAGKVGEFRGKRQLVHPEYVLLDRPGDPFADTVAAAGSGGSVAEAFAGALIPVYSATKEVRSWSVAKSVRHAFDMLDPVDDPLPSALRARHGLRDFDDALRAMHLPASWDDWADARARLKWDEALGIQLALAQRRAAAAQDPATARAPRADGLAAAFEAKLPFELTAGQVEVGEILAAELARSHPMHRLLQGEVGSGKTVVALRAMLQVVDAGGQAALLAPTEVLAAQHARSIEGLLGELAQAGRLGGGDDGTRVALLTGSLPTAARRAALLDAASGAAGIVVGTHALIQDQVQFADLGLVVVDEQHRFGVEQRDALRGKANQPPHVLVMTATPIPRTVAMTVFGDLESCTLTELPRGRSPITTSVVPSAEKPAWLERAWQRIREEVAAGHQAFVVCPRIGDSGAEAEAGDEPADDQPARRPPLAVEDVFAELTAGPLAGLRTATLHGRLPPEQKDAVMQAFAEGDLDVLVATTVIEVGVDVPNATVMVVLDAERFGVSQLHQLRGRIGRGAAPGLCLLITEAPPASPARERLDAVAATTDGFELARLDVEQRREGDILGASQSGRRSQLRLLSLLHDEELIQQARDEAVALVAHDRELIEHPGLAALVADLVADEQAEFLEKG
jgi:ATP-dependent DNA helicase RecG